MQIFNNIYVFMMCLFMYVYMRVFKCWTEKNSTQKDQISFFWIDIFVQCNNKTTRVLHTHTHTHTHYKCFFFFFFRKKWVLLHINRVTISHSIAQSVFASNCAAHLYFCCTCDKSIIFYPNHTVSSIGVSYFCLQFFCVLFCCVVVCCVANDKSNNFA